MRRRWPSRCRPSVPVRERCRARWTPPPNSPISALTGAAAVGAGPNPALLEAVIAATAAALGAGDTERAAAWLDELLDVADTVDYPYSRAHAAAMTVQLRALQLGWAAVAGDIDDLCVQTGWQLPSPLEHLVQPLRVRAFISAGRVPDAQAVADTMAVGPARSLAEAAVHWHRGVRRGAPDLAAPSWLAGARRGGGADPVRDGLHGRRGRRAHSCRRSNRARRSGLVQPFLDRGDDLDRLLRRAPVELARTVIPAQPPTPERETVPCRPSSNR